ncbi:histidine phosphatase family protein [Paenibacillus sp. MMS20-IR301]|uniref:histidine phosphatase family protein n=1 Tax=Paenibacillus sp. MMS20-IR301 TaxID=2895946 RepID=UPI0028E927E4|nr:histidine phosphatase family protein [Paenibacillus sp. MMS20-IR301]WNS41465.1 histidine phosphatase family protein [Paenibacillus sp. MMS20-IR301]
MITNLYLVRHAHSTYSADEINRPLSDKGLADAQRVTRLLLHENINILISSPYKRAVQTIEGLAEPLGLEVVIEEAFRERLLSAEPVSDFGQAATRVWEDFSFAWEGGESSLAAQQRGVQALGKLLKQYRGRNIAIGTHGNLMALMMNALDNRYDFTFWKQLDMPDIYKLSFAGDQLVDVQRIWGRSPRA